MSDRILDPAPELMRLIGLKLSELPKRFFKMPLRLYQRDIPERSYKADYYPIDDEKLHAKIDHAIYYPGGVLGLWITLYPYHPQSNFYYPTLRNFRGLVPGGFSIKVGLKLKNGIKRLKQLNYKHEDYLVVRQRFYEDHVSVLIVPPLRSSWF